MQLSLSKLPWYAPDRRVRRRVGVGGVRLLEVLRRRRSHADIQMRKTRLTALRADVAKGQCDRPAAAAVPGPGQRAREPAREPARRSCRSRRTSPTPCAASQTLATKSNLAIQRFTPGKVVAAEAVRRDSLQARGRRHVPQPRRRSSIRSASSRASSTSARSRSRRRQPPEPNRTIVAECVATTFVLQEGAHCAAREGRCRSSRRSKK